MRGGEYHGPTDHEPHQAAVHRTMCRRSSAGRPWHACLVDTTPGAAADPLTNWAGNYRYSTDRLHRRPVARRRAGLRQAARPPEGPRHAPLLQRHRRQHARSALGAGHGPHRRGGRGAPDGDRRSGHELRPVVPRPRSTGLRAAQPGVAAAHLHRRRVRHRDARFGRHQRQPGHGGVGPGDRHGQRRRRCTLSRDKDGSDVSWRGRQPRRPWRGHEGHARRATHLRDAPGRVPRPADGAGHGPLRGHRRGRLQRQPVHGLAAGTDRRGLDQASRRRRARR